MQLNELTALYSPLDVEYNQAMSGPYQDLSYHGQDCMVMAGLKDGRITGFWRPVVAVGDAKALKLHIERLYDISRDIVYMDFLEGGGLSVISRFLLRHGYRARPYYTQIIDKTKPITELHRALRKSYKSLVTKYENVGYGKLSDYRKLHSRSQYSAKTWDIQQKMVESGQANCMIDGDDAAILIYKNDYCAYYAGGKSLPGVNTHALIWQAIIRKGNRLFEMGEQVFSGDPKLVNISKFKAGFGGQTVTRLILEKESK